METERQRSSRPPMFTPEIVDWLQAVIDDTLCKAVNRHGVERILLDRGSDVTDLDACVDVRVWGTRWSGRVFSIFLPETVRGFLAHESPSQLTNDIYTTGGPLILVRSINADSIVRAVLRYAEMEHSRVSPS